MQEVSPLSVRTIVVTFRSLCALLDRRQRVILSVSAGLTVLAAFLGDVPAVLVGQLVDHLTEDRHGDVASSLVMITAVLVANAVLISLVHIMVHGVTPSVEARLRSTSLARVMRMAPNSTTSAHAASENSALSRGAEGGARLLRLFYGDLLPTIATVAWALVLAFHQQLVVGIVMLLAIPVGFTIVGRQVATQGMIRIQLERLKIGFDGVATELLRGREVVRSLNAIGQTTEHLTAGATLIATAETKHHRAMGLFDLAKSINENLFAVAVVAIGAVLVSRGNATPGSILTLFVLYMAVALPLRNLHRIIDEAFESVAQSRVMLEQFDRPTDPSFDRAPTELHSGNGPDVVVSAATVRYPGRSTHALDNVSLTISPGELTGFVGSTGSGKSTLALAIAGLAVVEHGTVALAGVDMGDLAPESVGDFVAYVPQATFLISDTIRENLILGLNGDPGDDAIVAAARAAQIHNVIQQLPRGYETRLGEDGRGLSGGERQRLAVARALLRHPTVLILDEATSALDNEHEDRLMRAVLATGVTVMAIAHRLDTLRSFDTIHVMEAGRVVESGSYTELLHRGGRFSQLARAKDESAAAADALV